MKRMMKVLSWLVVLVVVAAGAAIAYLFVAYPKVAAAETIQVDTTPARVARGKYLAEHVSGCLDCHARRDWTRYSAPVVAGTEGAGGERFGEPGSALELYSPNITPAGLEGWTDGEILRAITEGVSKDGRPLFPIMPYPKYARLSREDAESIVAFLRTIPAIAHEPPASRLGFPLNLIVRTLPAPAAFRAIPPVSDRVAYGEYMTSAAACGDCHTPQDDRGQPLPGMAFAGGFEIAMPEGGRIRTANITPDADTGIGTWTEEQFIQKFKAFEGTPGRVLAPEERLQNTIMPWSFYAGMTETDLGAIYVYLRSLPPVIHRVETYPGQSR